MKKYKLQEGSNSGATGVNTSTGNSRHERTTATKGLKSGLVSETSLAGDPTSGKGTANSRYVSTRPGTVQVIDGARALKTNASTPEKGTPDLIGKTVATATPKRKRY